MLENPRLEMAVQSALGFHEDIAYDLNYNGLAYDESEGERMARALGDKSVLMMGNHGVLVVGKTVPQAFERLYFLERAAQAQVLALSTGRPLRLIPEAVIEKTVAQFSTAAARSAAAIARICTSMRLKRVLDRATRITRAEIAASAGVWIRRGPPAARSSSCWRRCCSSTTSIAAPWPRRRT